MRRAIERVFAGPVFGNWTALTSVGYLLLIALAAVFGPSLMPGDPLALSADIMLPPGSAHWLGTDDLGRDVLTQLVYGTRVSLVVGGVAAVTATLLGTAVGSIAGFAGGLLDTAIMRVAEFFQVIPGFILAVVIVTFVGPGPTRVVAVIALLAWPQTARVARGEVLRLAHAEFVDALRCIGLAEWRILFGEVIPNALGPVIAVGTLIVGYAILLESSLSFLGLYDPNVMSWGRMLSAGQQFLFTAWWMSVFPGLAILLTVLSLNLLGDTLSDALDPRRMAGRTRAGSTGA
jgi:peptide/nickel transport system permease protein